MEQATLSLRRDSSVAHLFQEITEVRPRLSREVYERLLATERAPIHLWLILGAAKYLSNEEFQAQSIRVQEALQTFDHREYPAQVDRAIRNMAIKASRRMPEDEAEFYVEVSDLLDPHAHEPFELTPLLEERSEEVYAESAARGRVA